MLEQTQCPQRWHPPNFSQKLLLCPTYVNKFFVAQATCGLPGVGLADLPPEMLTRIFDHLEYLEALRTAPRVCRALRRVCGVSRLDLTAYLPDCERAGPGRSLESLDKAGQTDDLLQWLRRYGGTLWEFRAALGKLGTPEACATLQAIAERLGPTLSNFEISSEFRQPHGGLETSLLAGTLAGLENLSSIELPLSGQLTDCHLHALAKAQPKHLSLSYAFTLDRASNSFGYTQEGWSSFEALSHLSLTGGAIHHTWGLANAPIINLHLSHGRQLSLAGLKASSSLTYLCLDQPDLQHSNDSPWFQQLQHIASLRSLQLNGQPFGSVLPSSAVAAQVFHVSQLQSIGISAWVSDYSDNGSSLSHNGIASCPQLTDLCLSGDLFWPSSTFEAFPRLQSLRLECPNTILPSSLSTLTQLSYLYISRSGDNLIDEDSVPLNVNMVGHLVALQDLSLVDCRELEIWEEEAWLTLAASPLLQSVDLSGSWAAADRHWPAADRQQCWVVMTRFIIALKARRALPAVALWLDHSDC